MPSVNSINKIIALFVAALFFSACSDSAKEKAPPPTGKRVAIPETAQDVVSYLSDASTVGTQLVAKVKGKLTAPYMLRYQTADTPYTEFPRTLHVDFYKDSVKPNAPPVIESQLDAHYGKYLSNQDKVFLRDSVVVKNILKGDTVRCKELWWDQHTERFYTDKPVDIYEPDKILHGTGMEADQNFRWYKITKLTGITLVSENGMPVSK
jgi:LPS export ABC transporter protein LptC